jgi:hypothetical protein
MTGWAPQSYERLAALIERELELVARRSFDELASVRSERAELIRALPAQPPAEAGAALERCRQLQKRVEVELLRVREALLVELAQVRQAQRAANGYASPRMHAPRFRLSA